MTIIANQLPELGDLRNSVTPQDTAPSKTELPPDCPQIKCGFSAKGEAGPVSVAVEWPDGTIHTSLCGDGNPRQAALWSVMMALWLIRDQQGSYRLLLNEPNVANYFHGGNTKEQVIKDVLPYAWGLAAGRKIAVEVPEDKNVLESVQEAARNALEAV